MANGSDGSSEEIKGSAMSPLPRSSNSSGLAGPHFASSRTTRSRSVTKPDHRFLPFSAPDIDDDELAELTETLRAGWLLSGEKVRQFEREFAKFVGAKHALAVNNGTTAFRLSIQSLGLMPGDDVIMSPFAPVVVAELVRMTGATPRFVDVTERGLHLSPELLTAAITERTRAIVISHVAGLPAEMDELLAIARQHHLTIIEDAGHALTATYRHDMVGSLGDITCFTFFAQKAMSLGEGGMICTNNAELASQWRLAMCSPWSLVSATSNTAIVTSAANDQTANTALTAELPAPSPHGTKTRTAIIAKAPAANAAQFVIQTTDGYQASMNELTASLGLAQLRRSKGMWQRRREIAVTYNAAFSRFVELQCPTDRQDSQHSWHMYLLRLNLQRLRISRHQFLAEMQARNIGAMINPPPLHMQPLYAELFGYQPESFPIATQEYSREIALPIYSRMSDADVQRVIDAVEGIVKRFRAGTTAGLEPGT